MKRGVVLFAINNEKIDYITLAKLSAERVKRFLGLPVAVITDSHDLKYLTDSPFDQVIEIQNPDDCNLRRYHNGTREFDNLEFKNQSRSRIYELTPFEETLVIDSDYLISNDILSYCWSQDENFLIYKNSVDIARFRDDSEFLKINDYTIDFYWATVFFFRKCRETEVFFNLICHIKDNWNYYRFLYNIGPKLYRNDYSFSIGIHILKGFKNTNWPKELPGKLFYSLDRDILTSINGRSFTFLIEKEYEQEKYTLIKTQDISVHVMNKFSILELIKND